MSNQPISAITCNDDVEMHSLAEPARLSADSSSRPHTLQPVTSLRSLSVQSYDIVCYTAVHGLDCSLTSQKMFQRGNVI